MAKGGSGALLSVFIILCQTVSFAQIRTTMTSPDPARKMWVDSVYSKLSVEERIGQLFMVAAYSGGKDYNEAAITELVKNRQIGGLIFMQGDPVSQANQTNKYQLMAQVPLLIGMDAEWGLGMRLTGVKDLPRQIMCRTV
jgi:beta-N-acetylhexosaminidase